MAKIVDITESTFNRIIKAVKKIEGDASIKGKSKTKLVKRGGTKLYKYVEIISSVTVNEYLADEYDDPVTRTLLNEDITVYAIKHTLGTIPNSIAGRGEFALKWADGKYYIPAYSMFQRA